jgi:hypothetical protein
MHFYEAAINVRKPGDTSSTHVIHKRGLSAPEVIVLRHIFGDDSVVNIRPDGEKNIQQPKEIERLRANYVGRDDNGEPRDIIAAVFGPRPVLPLEIDDAVAEEEVVEEDEAPASNTLKLPKK